MKTIGDALGEQDGPKLLAVAHALGEAIGQGIGLSLGKAIGESFGWIEGLALGRAEDVLRILAARKIDVGTRVRQRILACTDVIILDRWFEQALNATSLEDLHLTE